MSMIMP